MPRGVAGPAVFPQVVEEIGTNKPIKFGMTADEFLASNYRQNMIDTLLVVQRERKAHVEFLLKNIPDHVTLDTLERIHFDLWADHELLLTLCLQKESDAYRKEREALQEHFAENLRKCRKLGMK